MNASVKVMNSYDYCHFEVALSADDITLEQVDILRKEAQRLVDKAIKQYKIARQIADNMPDSYLTARVEEMKKIKKSERTPEQKAEIQAYEDRVFRSRYDYEDDWDE